MAELVDALVSGTSVRKDVQVRVLFRVQKSSGWECGLQKNSIFAPRKKIMVLAKAFLLMISGSMARW